MGSFDFLRGPNVSQKGRPRSFASLPPTWKQSTAEGDSSQEDYKLQWRPPCAVLELPSSELDTSVSLAVFSHTQPKQNRTTAPVSPLVQE